jgi:hypothetical protein
MLYKAAYLFRRCDDIITLSSDLMSGQRIVRYHHGLWVWNAFWNRGKCGVSRSYQSATLRSMLKEFELSWPSELHIAAYTSAALVSIMSVGLQSVEFNHKYVFLEIIKVYTTQWHCEQLCWSYVDIVMRRQSSVKAHGASEIPTVPCRADLMRLDETGRLERACFRTAIPNGMVNPPRVIVHRGNDTTVAVTCCVISDSRVEVSQLPSFAAADITLSTISLESPSWINVSVSFK